MCLYTYMYIHVHAICVTYTIYTPSPGHPDDDTCTRDETVTVDQSLWKIHSNFTMIS